MMKLHSTLALLLALSGAGTACAADRATQPESAPQAMLARSALLLQAVHAGKRSVAVGEHGIVILSDDGGASWRQARSVPTTTTLTSVFFLNARQGWAAGHGGIVLGTQDGGDSWNTLTGKIDGPEILFSIWFKDGGRGVAVGPNGYAIDTMDGGKTWSRLPIGQGEDAERHLNRVFAGSDGTLLIAAEAGTVFRSSDSGHTWSMIKLPYKGSVWGGLALADDSLLLYGMRGHVLHSVDHGLSWSDAVAGTDQSLTGGAQFSDGSVVLVGLGGAVTRSSDGGHSFKAGIDAERSTYTDVLEGAHHGVLLFGQSGVHAAH